jgi:hypothetical protein
VKKVHTARDLRPVRELRRLCDGRKHGKRDNAWLVEVLKTSLMREMHVWILTRFEANMGIQSQIGFNMKPSRMLQNFRNDCKWTTVEMLGELLTRQ